MALFELFFEAHWQHLYIKAFKFLKNKDQACAIVQSIFIDLLQTKAFKEDRDWECHLSGLLKNKVLEQMRQHLAIDKSLEAKGASADVLQTATLDMAI